MQFEQVKLTSANDTCNKIFDSYVHNIVLNYVYGVCHRTDCFEITFYVNMCHV